MTQVDDVCIQPNAIDLRVDKIFKILGNEFVIDEESKTHRGSESVQPDADGYFVLAPGSYEVIMENIIKVAEGEAGLVITRSTLNRNGVFLTTGLYDSGYHGILASAMHVTSGPMRIKQGTRVGQYLNFDAEMLHAYEGSYGFSSDGKPKVEEEKYHD